MSGEIWTFKNILDESLRVARALHDAGIRQNDVVSIIAQNRFEFVSVAFGTLFLNAIFAPLNISYTERKSQALEIKLIRYFKQLLSGLISDSHEVSKKNYNHKKLLEKLFKKIINY